MERVFSQLSHKIDKVSLLLQNLGDNELKIMSKQSLASAPCGFNDICIMYYRCIKPNMEIPTVLYNATMHHFLNCWINSPLISVWEKFKFCTLNDVTSSSKRILGLKQNQSFECMYVSRYIHQVISWNKDLCKFNRKSKTTIKNISIFYSSYLFSIWI